MPAPRGLLAASEQGSESRWVAVLAFPSGRGAGSLALASALSSAEGAWACPAAEELLASESESEAVEWTSQSESAGVPQIQSGRRRR